MNAIQIQTTITGETLHLPELKPLVGKAVEITVREIAVPRVTPGADRWSEVVAAVEGLEDYDFDALAEMRAADIQHTSRLGNP